MSKMGQELEKRLDENKYKLYDVCQSVSKWLGALIAMKEAEHPVFELMKLTIDEILAEIEGK